MASTTLSLNVPLLLQDKPFYTLADSLSYQQVACRVHDDMTRLAQTGCEGAGSVPGVAVPRGAVFRHFQASMQIHTTITTKKHGIPSALP